MRVASESNHLAQAVPQSHHIRPIVQIKERQARIEDKLYLSKRKSDNLLAATASKAHAKNKLHAVRCTKSYS